MPPRNGLRTTSPAENDIKLKLLVLGDIATGKTSILKRYMHNFFTGQYTTTLGVDFHLKQINIGDKTIRLQMWDIAGQERFSTGSLARVYYQGAFGAVLVYDITRPETLETVPKWKETLDSRVLLPNGHPIPVVLLANKCDLNSDPINVAEMDEFAAIHGFCGWFETSARLNINIDKACRFLVDCILDEPGLFDQSTESPYSDTIRPGAEPAAKSSFDCC